MAFEIISTISQPGELHSRLQLHMNRTESLAELRWRTHWKRSSTHSSLCHIEHFWFLFTVLSSKSYQTAHTAYAHTHRTNSCELLGFGGDRIGCLLVVRGAWVFHSKIHKTRRALLNGICCVISVVRGTHFSGDIKTVYYRHFVVCLFVQLVSRVMSVVCYTYAQVSNQGDSFWDTYFRRSLNVDNKKTS